MVNNVAFGQKRFWAAETGNLATIEIYEFIQAGKVNSIIRITAINICYHIQYENYWYTVTKRVYL